MRPVLEDRLDLVLGVLDGRRDREDELVFSEGVLAERPLAAILEQVHAAAASGGGFDVLERRQLDRNTIGAWIRGKRDASMWILKIGVEVAPSRRIEEFSLTPTPGPQTAPGEAWRVFDALAGNTDFRVACFAAEIAPDGAVREIHARDADDRLAIGTLGMLWTHAALSEWIAGGGAAWDDPLLIDDSLRSPPDSRTSMTPPGESLTLRTLASRALVEADNTAAEHLVAMLGRERIEQARDRARAAGRITDPTDGEPFLSPAEMYRLKCGVSDLVNRYAEASNAERRRLLEHRAPASAIDPALFLTWTKPQQLERVGWHATAREVCLTLAGLWDLCKDHKGCDGLRTLASHRPDAQAEDGCIALAITGGEPGAIAAAWLRERPDGRVVLLALILNDPERPVSERKSAAIVMQALDALRRDN